MPVAVFIVKWQTSLNDFVWKNLSEYSWLRFELHNNWTIFYALTLLGIKYILRRILEMSYLTETLVNLCRVFRWCFMEYIPEPSVLVFGEKVQFICHPHDPPAIQLKRRTEELSHCQRCLVFLSVLCPSTILSSGIWEGMWSEKAI